ncbi:hypothetical protein ACIBCN_33195 [Nocardia sp. NPDC051052]|uniref:hypothetical protein n=1 Tax=Nocardia sp. NPDC051052 TaxID=3364322 RepID=UPI0037B34271
MENKSSDVELSGMLANSRSDDNATRAGVIAELGRYMYRSDARKRLEEIMIGNEIVTMRVDAAEQPTRYGGEEGLLAVLNELGRRQDSEVDYTAYMLSELDNFGEFPVLDTALSINEERLTPDAKRGLTDLRALMQR